MRVNQIRDFVISYLVNHLTKDDVVIDATIGNGHDTLLLADLCKYVYGFDVQQQALDTTQTLLNNHQVSNFKLIHDSHENMINYVKDFKAVIFNLGYLPNSNKEIKTTKDSTMNTLNTLVGVMKPDSFIIITCYPGHDEGFIESEAVIKFVSHLDNSFTTLKYDVLNKNKSPFVILIEKNH
jgi:hypothetical protein